MNKFLMLGKTGVGKSSFINSVYGIEVAKTSKYEPCTKIVESHVDDIKYGQICIVDTPGLGEGIGGKIDNQYANLIREYIGSNKIFKFIYVTSLRETRFRSDEMNTIITLTRILGKKIWKKTWLVFTYAADYTTDNERVEAMNQRNYDIHKLIFENFPKFDKEKLLFEKYIVIDNLTNNWCTDAESIHEAFKY